MTVSQTQEIQNFIAKYPELSNSKLATKIKEESTILSGLTEGSLRNYIGKVKLISGETPTVPAKTMASESMQNSTSTPDTFMTIREIGYGVELARGSADYERRSDLTVALETTGLDRSHCQQIISSVFNGDGVTIFFNSKGVAGDIAAELYGYGFDAKYIGTDENNEYVVSITGLASEVYTDVIPFLSVTLATPETVVGSMLGTITANNPLVISCESVAAAEALVQNLKGLAGDSITLVLGVTEHNSMTFNFVSGHEVSFNPLAVVATSQSSGPDYRKAEDKDDGDYTDKDEAGITTTALEPVKVTTKNKPYDYLIMGISDATFTHANLSDYYTSVHDNCNAHVIVFGNEPRLTELSNYGRVDAASGGIGEGIRHNCRGLKEEYCLYDAISAAIAHAFRAIKDLENTDVTITIASDTFYDWGSTTIGHERILELIGRCRAQFGWNFAGIGYPKGLEAEIVQDRAIKLGLDSTNVLMCKHTGDLSLKLAEARTTRNIHLNNEVAQPYGYFK